MKNSLTGRARDLKEGGGLCPLSHLKSASQDPAASHPRPQDKPTERITGPMYLIPEKTIGGWEGSKRLLSADVPIHPGGKDTIPTIQTNSLARL